MIDITETAYVELLPGESPPWHSLSCWEEGTYQGKSESGLEVSWPDDSEIPNSSQIYLVWEPKVYAVWEEENDEESNGTEVGTTGNANDEESNWGAEQLGNVHADVQAAEAKE